MKEGYTHISLVLDKSGSMRTILGDTIGGFNTFLVGQKETAKEGDTFSLLQFSTTQEYTYKLAHIQDVQELNDKNFKPSGGTALLDAVADAIRDLGKHFASIEENQRPSKVIFVILTDGGENSSERTTRGALNELITEHTKVWKWEFIFLGANQDAIQEAATFGIHARSSMTFGANKRGVSSTYESLTRSINTFKVAPAGMNYADSGAAFTVDERSASMGGVSETIQINLNASSNSFVTSVNLTGGANTPIPVVNLVKI